MGKYDNCGNRITKETPFGKITYKYDSENRLIGSTSFGTENKKNLYIKNEYDKNGNLLKSISPQKEIYYSYNAENRIETVLIIDHVHKTKTEESYFYDSFGRRVKEIKNGIEVYYQYEGLSFNLLTETMYKVDFLEKGDFELDSELNLSFDSNYKNSYDFSSENLAYRYRYITDEVKPLSTKSYYYKDGNLVANAGTRSSAYFFSDYQGSTRYVTDTEGFSESYNYDSFGKPIYNGDYVGYEEGYFEEGLSKSDLETSGYETYKTTNWLTKREENPQSSLYQEYLSVAGYSGKSYNQDTGLNNYGFRDYSPTQARFITVDPIQDGTNWYTLAVNNPVCFVDLWGLCTGDKKAPIQVIISYTKNSYDKMTVVERVLNPDGTIDYLGGVTVTTFTATNVVKTPEQRNNVPVSFNGYNYFPEQFPSGTWMVYMSAESKDEYIGPIKIATNAFTYVSTYENVDGIWQMTDVSQKDEGYMIHSGIGDTTWGCIKMSDNDVKVLAEIVDNAINSGGYVMLIVK